MLDESLNVSGYQKWKKVQLNEQIILRFSSNRVKKMQEIIGNKMQLGLFIHLTCIEKPVMFQTRVGSSNTIVGIKDACPIELTFSE